MKFDFITIGGSTEDITFYTQEGLLINNKKDILRQNLLAFEYGAKLQVDKAYSNFGGGAANAAVGLANLGLSVATFVAIGEDIRGMKILENFKTKKVNTSLIQKKKEISTGFSFFLVGQQNEHVCFSYRAANDKLEIKPDELKRLAQAKWIYLTSLSGKWPENLTRIFSLKNVKISWNPGHIQLHKGIKALGKHFKKTEVLIVNKDEALELVVSDPQYRDKNNKYLNEIKNLLNIIKGWGPKIVVVTNGKYGADAYDGKNYYHQNIIKEKRRINTTGVGDAFGSTFSAGLEMFNGNIKRAMYMGACNTASVVGAMGAQIGLLSKAEMMKKMKKF